MKITRKKLKVGKLFSKAFAIYKKNWFNFILIGIIFALVSGLSYMFGFEFDQYTGQVFFTPSGIMNFLAWLAIVYLSVGFIRYLLNLLRGGDAKMKEIFHGVDSIVHFVFVILVAIVVSIITMVGFVVLIIPGIIASLGLMFAKYIIAENKGGEVEVWEAVKRSWQITKGYKWKLLWLSIVVFLFNMLGFFVLVVGLVVTIPVTALVLAEAYRVLESGELLVEEKGQEFVEVTE